MYTSVHVLYIYTLCYFTGIIYAVVRQISLLFTDEKESVFCILYRRLKRLVSVSAAFRADQSAFDRQQVPPCVPSSSSDHLPTLGAGWEHGTRPTAAGARSIQLRSLSWARGCRIASPNKVTLHALSSADDSPPAPQTINISRGWVGGRQIDTPPQKKRSITPPPHTHTQNPPTHQARYRKGRYSVIPFAVLVPRKAVRKYVNVIVKTERILGTLFAPR